MDVYGVPKSNNTAGIILCLVQVLWIGAAFFLVASHFFAHTSFGADVFGVAAITILTFDLLTFGRFFLTLFVFLKRQSPLDEMVSVSIAFGVYYVGFLYLLSLGGSPTLVEIGAGILLFAVGSLLNSLSEFQRLRWKQKPENKGRLCTTGVFSLTRHPNYFGDVLWVLGFALVSGNLWSLLIPALLLVFFWKGNIPMQEKHLVEKYGDQMTAYMASTKSLIPFVL